MPQRIFLPNYCIFFKKNLRKSQKSPTFAATKYVNMKKTLLIITFAVALFALPSWASDLTVGDVTEEEVLQPAITVSGSNIRVINAADKVLEVYDVAGVCVATLRIDSDDRTFHLNLSKGCYILKVGKVVRKVSIR